MRLRDRIEHWKRNPNALGSEAQAAVIVGEVANALGEQIPDNASAALKKPSLRGTMRDIAAAIQHGEQPNPGVSPFHDVVDAGAAAAGLSWTEAISTITRYLDAASERLG